MGYNDIKILLIVQEFELHFMFHFGDPFVNWPGIRKQLALKVTQLEIMDRGGDATKQELEKASREFLEQIIHGKRNLTNLSEIMMSSTKYYRRIYHA